MRKGTTCPISAVIRVEPKAKFDIYSSGIRIRISLWGVELPAKVIDSIIYSRSYYNILLTKEKFVGNSLLCTKWNEPKFL